MDRTHSEQNDFNSDRRAQRGRGRRGPRLEGPFAGGPRFDPDFDGPRFDGGPEGPGRPGRRPSPDDSFRGPRGEGFRGPRDERFDPEQDGPRGPRHGRGGRRGHGPRGGRAARGDVRATILRLLAEAPMHGYQLMQTIAERSGGRWSPSPGAVYPTLSALADEGLITLVESEGRKLATLTEAGQAHVSEHQASWADPFADAQASGEADLPALMHEVHAAVRHAGQAATASQRERIGKILTQARSDIYSALAQGDSTEDAGE